MITREMRGSTVVNPVNLGRYPSYRPYTNIQPFTVRDGATYLIVLESLRTWIRDTLVPHVDNEIGGLSESWAEQVTAVTDAFANEVDRLVQEMVDNAIELQDPVMLALLNDVESLTRSKIDEILSAFYTITSADSTFESKGDASAKANARYLKSETDAAISSAVDAVSSATSLAIDALQGELQNVSDEVATISDVLETGRLSETPLDDRYVKEFHDPVAVFIGSSNAEPDTGWVETFCTRNGLVNKNFAVGGGGFNQPGALSFYTQATNAIADTSFDKSKVKFVFIVDLSNDTRGKASVVSSANTVFTMLESAYPNARIIVVPEVMPLTPANYNDPEVLMWITRHYNEVRNVSVNFKRVEVINNSWLWFWDTGSWSKGETIDVHLNPAGYTRLARFIEQYAFHGVNHDNDIGDNTGTVGIPGSIHARRSGGITTVFGTFTLATDQTTSVTVAALHRCFAHIKQKIPVTVWRNSDGMTKTIEYATDGKLNSNVVIPSGTWHYQVSFITI